MRRKVIIGTLIFCLTLLVFTTVQAGYLFDFGELEGHPDEGEANWMAWYRTYPDGRPLEILTEDNTNCLHGEDIGYSDIYLLGQNIEEEDDYLEWILQPMNFLSPPEPEIDVIKMLFGGLGTHSKTLWKTSFEYDNTIHWEDHGIVDKLEGEYPACPTLYEPTAADPNTRSFYSTEPGTYLVYRSQNASGHPTNGASNGRYRYFTKVETATGYGTFTDPAPDPKWYIVFQVDGSNTPIGCHSEPANPTGARDIVFETEFDLAEKVIRLSWGKSSEDNLEDILGFNIWRSTIKHSEGKIINDGIIPMNQKTFVDDDLEFGETYYYRLEIIGLHCTRADLFGPISQRAGYFFFMPLIQEGD